MFPQFANQNISAHALCAIYIFHGKGLLLLFTQGYLWGQRLKLCMKKPLEHHGSSGCLPRELTNIKGMLLALWLLHHCKAHRYGYCEMRYIRMLLLLGAFDWLTCVDPAVLIRVSPKQELIERSHSPSRGDVMHLRPAPCDPLHKPGTGGWPGWAPGMTSKLFERTGGGPGSTQGSYRTHPLSPVCGWSLCLEYVAAKIVLHLLLTTLHVTLTDIDKCLSSPCMNGATCVDEVNRFSCTCPRGFEGDTCATGRSADHRLVPLNTSITPNLLSQHSGNCSLGARW